MYPENETEFNQLMEGIDNDLKKQGIPIFGRPLWAIRAVCSKLKISLAVAPIGPAIPGVYSGDSLSRRIEAWYGERYGDRLGGGLGPGNVAVLIKGDPWKVKLPLFYGQLKFVFDPCLEKYVDTPMIDPVATNPLRWIEGFKSELAKSLTKEEMSELAHFLVFALMATRGLPEIHSEPLIPEARVDLEMAVSNLFLPRPHCGQSKWSSLQFAEKLLKCFLTLKNATVPQTHDLAGLAGLSASHGLQTINPGVLGNIQCPAGVRYGQIKVKLDEAITAHHSSLEVCGVVCSAIIGPKSAKAVNARRAPH